MTHFEGTPEDMLKVLPKQLGAMVNYHVTLTGATRIVEKQASSTRADVMARTLAGKMFDQSHLPIHALTQSLGLLTEEQLDLVQQAERAVERFTKSDSYVKSLKKALMTMSRFSHWTTPHEYLIAWISDRFNEKALRYIVDYTDISFSLPVTVMTCFALDSAGIEVNERTLTHHLSFIQLVHNGLGWAGAEGNLPYYGKEAVKVIHEYPERLNDIADYYGDRGETLSGLREYLLSEKALASGVL